jgi:hypothetical protein
MIFLEAGQHPAKSGGERAAVQTLREVWLRLENAAASGLRWLQPGFSPRARSGFLVAGLLFVAGVAFAQSSDDVPPLLPARPEIPPTLWEQHGILIVGLSVLAVALAAAAIWWLLQPQPPVPVPIEIQTRQELERLNKNTEDGKTISRVSQVLKRYVAVAFEFPPGEMTTTEFNRAARESEKLGQQLTTQISDFLRQCDEQKFSPTAGVQISAGARAVELFQAGEARRAELRQNPPAT